MKLITWSANSTASQLDGQVPFGFDGQVPDEE